MPAPTVTDVDVAAFCRALADGMTARNLAVLHRFALAAIAADTEGRRPLMDADRRDRAAIAAALGAFLEAREATLDRIAAGALEGTEGPGDGQG